MALGAAFATVHLMHQREVAVDRIVQGDASSRRTSNQEPLETAGAGLFLPGVEFDDATRFCTLT